MFASYRPKLMVLALLVLTSVAHAQTYPADCTPTPTPPGCIPPPEWTPRLTFNVPTQPEGGGSVPRPGYVPPLLPGELDITVPITWDLYQATVTYIAGVNPQVIYGTFNVIRYQMQRGDSFVAHLSAGPCFVVMRHQVPVPPSQATNVQGQAHGGSTAIVGAATSINGDKAACATNQNGQATAGPGDVTIEVL